jgi:transmembrane sensor
MTSAPNLLNEDRDQEAREWFVLLMDNDTPQDVIVAWTHWIEADSENRAAYDRVAEIWGLAAAVSDEEIRPSAVERRADDYDGALPVAAWRKTRRPRLRLVWSAGAAAVALAVITVGSTQFHWTSPPQDFATQPRQHMSTKLEDGTLIHLAAATSLQVDYARGRRAIALRKGEALFEVAHEPRRPFVVSTSLADVTAVGTAFDIDVDASRVTLYVTEGVVSVDMAKGTARPGTAPLTVLKGQQVTLRRANGRIVVLRDFAMAAPAWREGSLYYRDEALSVVLADVNRYADRPIRIADPALGDLRYTGTVRLDATDLWLKALPAAFPIVVEPGPAGPILKKSPRSIPLREPRTS